MSNRMHAPPACPRARALWQLAARAAAVPGLDRLLAYGASAVFAPERACGCPRAAIPPRRTSCATPSRTFPATRASLAHGQSAARNWPRGAQSYLLDEYPRLDMPVLLLWADQDRLHPLAAAEEALARLPRGQLRVLESVGFLMAYDDPVGLTRELTAFCG